MKNKILGKFERVRIKNRRNNEIRKILININELVSQRNIKDNPVLKRLKKEHWTIDVNNKHLIRRANRYTLDIVVGALLGEEFALQDKSEREGE